MRTVKVRPVVRKLRLSTYEKVLSARSSRTFTAGFAVFDERNRVAAAGLLPVLELAEQAGLSELIDTHVDLTSRWVASGAVNPVGKLMSTAGVSAGG
ncbi:hypothetical protein [Rhodococcus jostii]|uniref:hypothetical protein n=1 Tax=Rhodococcus jostii TaxID=132919 RepID=UPI00365339A4